MDTLDAIQQRRSVKHYDPTFVMPAADEKTLLESLRHAPTSFNIQNWRFVVVKDPDLRTKLRAAAWDQAQITDAALTVVICADIKAWDKNPERYWADAPQAVRDFLVPMIGSFYKGRDAVQRDEAMRSAGIAAQTLMLAAKSMGYDSCPMIGFNPEEVGKIVNLPNDHVVCMLVVVGKAAQPAQSKGGFLPQDEVVFYDRFVA